MPKLSVIVPVYNTEKYLSKCLDSLTGQTLSDIEIICINDCSTDNSLAILNEYATRDNRIEVINFKENCGVSIARNTGIDVATGEYIGFVDSDDFIDSDFYEKLYNKAMETQADAVKGNVYDCDENGNNPTLTEFYDINDKVRKNKANFLYGFTSGIYKTNLIKKHNICFPENISYFEDPYFNVAVTLIFNKIETIDSARYYYVKHDKSTCANCKTLAQTKAFTKSIRVILNLINSKEIPEENYIIYVVFLIQQIVPWCSDLELPDDANMEAVKGVCYILTNTKHSLDNLLFTYFMKIKQDKNLQIKRNNESVLKQLREKMKGNKA